MKGGALRITDQSHRQKAYSPYHHQLLAEADPLIFGSTSARLKGAQRLEITHAACVKVFAVQTGWWDWIEREGLKFRRRCDTREMASLVMFRKPICTACQIPAYPTVQINKLPVPRNNFFFRPMRTVLSDPIHQLPPFGIM